MQNIRNISENLYWVGASDRRLALFENLFPLESGVAYNSYLLLDDKTVVFDTVDASVSRQFVENVQAGLAGRDLDYVVINHMEPDHCSNIDTLVALYPNVKLVGNAKTFQLFEQFYTLRDQANYVVVKEGDELNLGQHNLKFFMAPMVHWPEVMMTFETTQGWLFSADAFGSFGALDGNLFADEYDYKGRTLDEARRYYVNIVGKFGVNVMVVLNKFKNLNINMILPLHGPLYRGEDIAFIVDKYTKWATYTPEINSVLLIYGSMYGNTENAIDILAKQLSLKGVKNIKIYDASKTDPSYMISDLWEYSHVVFASANYNGDCYYKVENLIREALALNFQNRKISFVTNFSWGGKALKTMQDLLITGKRMDFVGEPVTLKSSVKDSDEDQIAALAASIAESL